MQRPWRSLRSLGALVLDVVMTMNFKIEHYMTALPITEALQILA